MHNSKHRICDGTVSKFKHTTQWSTSDYAGNMAIGHSYNLASADFAVPYTTGGGGALAAIWAGLGGYQHDSNNGHIIQGGVDIIGDGRTTMWIENYPSDSGTQHISPLK